MSLNTKRYQPKHQSAKTNKWDKLILGYSFFMAFPTVVFFQNISVYIFLIMLYFIAKFSNKPLIKISKPIQWIAIFFAIGAILSIINAPNYSNGYLVNSLKVLPNYLYWVFLILFFITHHKLINLEIIYKGVFWGISASTIYFLSLQQYLTKLPIFYVIGSNSYSFLLICYTPMALIYLKKNKGLFWAIGFLLIITIIQLIDGRRAGTILVIAFGLATLFLTRFDWRKIIFLIILTIPGFFIFKSNALKSLIKNANERVYNLVYNFENVQKEDRSYLFRVAMIKKGLIIFNDHKFTGIGLNNFKNYQVTVGKGFEGAEFVIYKKKFNELSSHNSYINILAEGGLVLFIPFVMLLLSIIVFFIYHFNRIQLIYLPIFWGVIGMSIHLYFIAAIVNVYAWFLIAIASSISSHYASHHNRFRQHEIQRFSL